MEFSLFPPEALQAAEFQIARQRRLDSPPNPVFLECVSMFLQWFPSKHGTLHFCRHKTGRKHHVRQCFQFPYLHNRWKYRYLQCFLQFFHVPMPVANSNIYIYKKSFQNIVFDSVFPMFPVKQTVIYTFFAIKAVNPSKTLLLTVENFHFSPPWRLPKLGNFRFSPPWGLPKRGNFHFSCVGASQAKNFHFPPRGGSPS